MPNHGSLGFLPMRTISVQNVMLIGWLSAILQSVPKAPLAGIDYVISSAIFCNLEKSEVTKGNIITFFTFLTFTKVKVF